MRRRRLAAIIIALLLLIGLGLWFLDSKIQPQAASLEMDMYTIKGYVFVPSSEGAGDGARVASAQVSLNRSSGMGNWYDSAIETLTTDSSGQFEFKDVPASGTDGYMLCVNADEYFYRQQFVVVSENLTVNVDLAPIRESAPYELWGYVTNASSGLLIGDVYVSISGPISDTSPVVSYQRWNVVSGYYEFWNLPSGVFTVTASCPHFISQTISVTLGGNLHYPRHDFNLQCLKEEIAKPNSPANDQSPPVAYFTQNAYLTLVNAPITFDASQSSDADGSIVKYIWDWEGDGIYDVNFTIADPVVHAYLAAGTYQPTLKVIDNDGNVDTWHPEQATVVMEQVNTVPEVPLGTIAVTISMIAALLAFFRVPKTRFFKR